MTKPSSRLLFFILCILITPTANAQSILDHVCVSKQGNYTNNSTYHTNLYNLLSSLTAIHDFDSGFYTSSKGKNPDKVYATGLCRGYVEQEDCRSCLNDATQVLTQLCPNHKEAIGWYEKCTLRYSNRNLFGIMETDPLTIVANAQNVSSDVDVFSQKLMVLFENLTSRAVTRGSSLKYAVGNTTVPNYFWRVYALVQCSPDLSSQDCNSCIVVALRSLEQCCYGRLGVYVALPSCMINYALNRFYDLTDDTPTQLPPPPPLQTNAPPPLTNGSSTGKGKTKNTSRSVTIIVVPSICAFMILVISISLYSRMRMRKNHATEEEMDFAAECLQFNFGTIRVATNDFSDENKLGQGGFGAVYRGRLSTGEDIAVKRMIRDSDPAGLGDLEFKNEVALVARLGHRNLVNLLGFCLEKNERLLVYELVQNSSLDRFIFDPIERENLNWDVRFKIILGIARGLLYLHEESRLKIIHRDLKAGNILLDAKMNPKISDFGTARLFTLDQSNEKTRRVVGTFGYMAPEYVRRGRFSVKSDVFSFGVLVLEIVSGQNVRHFRCGDNVESLLTYAWKSWNEGKAMNFADPTMRETSRHEIIRCIQIGLLCVQEKNVDRPMMGSVVLMLSSNSLGLRQPSQPAYFMRSSTWETGVMEPNQSENNHAQISNNVVSVTELSPR